MHIHPSIASIHCSARTREHRPVSISIALLALMALGCERGDVEELLSGFDYLALARSSLTSDGTVAVATSSNIVSSNGTSTTTRDLEPHGLELQAGSLTRPFRIRTGGEVVLVANHAGVASCFSVARGAYRLLMTGGAVTTLHENCPEDTSDGAVGRDIALSPSGTVAFSQIRNGLGAIYRGPATGPVSIHRSGSGIFYNTGALDVNDSGRVGVQMEYTDGSAGGLMRGILVFDTPELPRADMLTAIEKLGIGTQPSVSMNSSGVIAFALNGPVSIPIGGTTYNYDAGVYVAVPTQFDTPKSLTRIVPLAGGYCRFGAVEINDSGTVVFEAALTGELGCTSGGLTPTYDGIFSGADPEDDAIVVRGQSRLGGHQYFDSIYLGELNNAGQVSFTTTYSEPLVEPVKVWRWDP